MANNNIIPFAVNYTLPGVRERLTSFNGQVASYIGNNFVPYSVKTYSAPGLIVPVTTQYCFVDTVGANTTLNLPDGTVNNPIVPYNGMTVFVQSDVPFGGPNIFVIAFGNPVSASGTVLPQMMKMFYFDGTNWN